MNQLALPLEIPETERDYHPHDNWNSILCRRCGQVLWHPIHGLSPDEKALHVICTGDEALSEVER